MMNSICDQLTVTVFGFYVPPTAKVIRRRDLGLKSHPKYCICDHHRDDIILILKQFFSVFKLLKKECKKHVQNLKYFS